MPYDAGLAARVSGILETTGWSQAEFARRFNAEYGDGERVIEKAAISRLLDPKRGTGPTRAVQALLRMFCDMMEKAK